MILNKSKVSINKDLYITKRHFDTRKVIQIDCVTNKTVAIYSSIINAAKAVGVNKSCIWDCINGFQKTSAGFRWEYLKQIGK